MTKLSTFIVLLLVVLLGFKPIDSTIVATVDYSVSGCFSSGKGKLVISRKNDITTAELTTTEQQKFTAVLTEQQMEAFRKFVRQLKTAEFSYGCTTQYEYIVHFENEVIKKTDGSCKWEGFFKLRKQLFGNSY